jgi:hypothetical protein
LDGDQPIVLEDLTVTPVAVDHGPKAPGAVGFVVQHGDRKAILTGALAIR